MEIEFVNHSSFVLRHNDVVLMVDPWLDGRVFNNGWDLIAPTKFRYEDFASVTHIWFSHEHPDHFFPPNISKISEEHRKNITVLFQITPDKRVVNYCKKMGFKDVREIKPDEVMRLGDDFEFMCEHYQEGDSWMIARSKDLTIFNTNDCGIRDTKEAIRIAKKAGKVDVLLTQFSYAYWAGNKDQVDLRRKVANDKLDGLKFQADHFNPKIIIPVASFIWFCHEENFYLNDEINRPQKVYDYIQTHTKAKPILLHPGQIYTPFGEDPSKTAIELYNSDFERILTGENLVKNNVVELVELEKHAKTFIQNLVIDYGMWSRLLKPCNIWLTDKNMAFQLSLEKGLLPVQVNENQCDASLSSESLLFNFKFPWGNDTLGINGRYQRPEEGNYSRFYNFFRYNQLKSRGIQIGLGYFSGMAVRKALVKLGLQKT
jgi:UDP-MurNAc hydroxylase